MYRNTEPTKRDRDVNPETPSTSPPSTPTVCLGHIHTTPPASHPKANISATKLDLFSVKSKRRLNLSLKVEESCAIIKVGRI
jgi:hypothetical protein